MGIQKPNTDPKLGNFVEFASLPKPPNFHRLFSTSKNVRQFLAKPVSTKELINNRQKPDVDGPMPSNTGRNALLRHAVAPCPTVEKSGNERSNYFGHRKRVRGYFTCNPLFLFGCGGRI